jgi:thiamine biosynthesis protein ThiS
MEIWLNGAPITREAPPIALSDFLKEQKISPEGIAVAVNDSVIRKAEWPEYIIRDGDRIEIVYARQGG